MRGQLTTAGPPTPAEAAPCQDDERHTAALAPLTRRLVDAPVLPTLLRLAAPNTIEAVARVSFLSADAVFVAWLGDDALAAVTLVLPILLVFQSLTASGFGQGVSSTIAQALGAGRVEAAEALAGTSVVLALVGSTATTAVFLDLGPALYRLMGASDAVVDLTIDYGAIIFGGILLIWGMNILANVARAGGQMMVSSFGIFTGEVFHVLLSPALIVGWGPFPRLGISGAALGVIASYGVGSAVIGGFLLTRRSMVRLKLRHLRIRFGETRAILAVGAPAAFTATLFWSTGFLATALVGQLGKPTLVGYGIGTRLDIVQYPLIFGFSTAVATMVGTAIGAKRLDRAASVTWTGCVVGAVVGAAFAVIAVFGDLWLRLFTADPEIKMIGTTYLLCQAVMYPVFGAGLAGVFASVAAGNVRLPLVTTVLRLIVTVVGGWLALKIFVQALAVFIVLAAAGMAYGAIMLVGLATAGAQTRSSITARMNAHTDQLTPVDHPREPEGNSRRQYR